MQNWVLWGPCKEFSMKEHKQLPSKIFLAWVIRANLCQQSVDLCGCDLHHHGDTYRYRRHSIWALHESEGVVSNLENSQWNRWFFFFNAPQHFVLSSVSPPFSPLLFMLSTCWDRGHLRSLHKGLWDTFGNPLGNNRIYHLILSLQKHQRITSDTTKEEEHAEIRGTQNTGCKCPPSL